MERLPNRNLPPIIIYHTGREGDLPPPEFTRDLLCRMAEGAGYKREEMTGEILVSDDRRCGILGGNPKVTDNNIIVASGVIFDSRRSTPHQVIEKEGLNEMGEVDGMWVGGVYDKTTQTLRVGRDQFGFLPVKIAEVRGEKGGIIAVAPHLAWLYPGLLKELKANWEMLSLLALVFLQAWGEKDFVIGIENLRNGHTVAITPQGKERQERYFDFGGIETRPISDEEFRDKFREVVRLRMETAERLAGGRWAVMLSGGIDSSIVTAVVVNLAPSLFGDGRRILAFNLSYREDPEGSDSWLDRQSARAVANMYEDEIVLREVIEDTRIFEYDAIVKVIKNLGRPPELPEIIGIDSLFRAVANEGIRATLPGHGPDELFGGYDGYASYYYGMALKGEDVLGKVTSGDYYRKIGRLEWVKRVFEGILRDNGGIEIEQVLGDYMSEYRRSNYQDPLKRVMHHMLSTFTPGVAEIFYNLSRPYGVIELPTFLSLPMVCLAFAMDERQKRQGPEGMDPALTKGGLRRIFAGLLPPEIVYHRRKSGFPAPHERTIYEVLRRVYLTYGSPFNLPIPNEIIDVTVSSNERPQNQPLFFLVALRAWQELFNIQP